MISDPRRHESGARSATDGAARHESSRAIRWADVFGELLPDQTSDDVDEPGAWATRSGAADSDDLERFRRDKPPHHVD